MYNKKDLIRPERIIIHHSLTKDSGTVSWNAIRRYHIETNGWSDIGYHYGIEIINGEPNILIGRPSFIKGAHAKGNNHNSIGICIVGNFDKSYPENYAYDFTARLIFQLYWNINSFRDLDKIIGHNEVSTKSCPGKFFDINYLKRKVNVLVDQLLKRDV